MDLSFMPNWSQWDVHRRHANAADSIYPIHQEHWFVDIYAHYTMRRTFRLTKAREASAVSAYLTRPQAKEINRTGKGHLMNFAALYLSLPRTASFRSWCKRRMSFIYVKWCSRQGIRQVVPHRILNRKATSFSLCRAAQEDTIQAPSPSTGGLVPRALGSISAPTRYVSLTRADLRFRSRF